MKKLFLSCLFISSVFTGFASENVIDKTIADLAAFPKTEPTLLAQAKKTSSSKKTSSQASEGGRSSVPSNLFSRYAGKWTGDFWVYSPDGVLQESKSVMIEYKPSGKNMTMETFYLDRISKQWVVAETATYTNNGGSVKVSIRRPNSEMASQTGYYTNGSLFLTSDNIKSGVEQYRETLDGQRLLVDGFGIYGDVKDSHVFIGRFVRQK